MNLACLSRRMRKQQRSLSLRTKTSTYSYSSVIRFYLYTSRDGNTSSACAQEARRVYGARVAPAAQHGNPSPPHCRQAGLAAPMSEQMPYAGGALYATPTHVSPISVPGQQSQTPFAQSAAAAASSATPSHQRQIVLDPPTPSGNVSSGPGSWQVALVARGPEKAGMVGSVALHDAPTSSLPAPWHLAPDLKGTKDQGIKEQIADKRVWSVWLKRRTQRCCVYIGAARAIYSMICHACTGTVCPGQLLRGCAHAATDTTGVQHRHLDADVRERARKLRNKAHPRSTACALPRCRTAPRSPRRAAAAGRAAGSARHGTRSSRAR